MSQRLTGEPADSLTTGRIIGDYEIESIAASGGMGIVYRATQRSLFGDKTHPQACCATPHQTIGFGLTGIVGRLDRTGSARLCGFGARIDRW